LIPSIAKSQTGSTQGKKFWFTESQVHEMYEVMFDLDFYEWENENLGEHIRLQDSIINNQKAVNINLKSQLETRTTMYNNQLLITEQWEQKYKISENTINSLKNIKTALIITTGVIAVATVVAIIK